jgi:hypothetical protein
MSARTPPQAVDFSNPSDFGAVQILRAGVRQGNNEGKSGTERPGERSVLSELVRSPIVKDSGPMLAALA